MIVKMFPEFKVLVEIYIFMYNENKEKIVGESIAIYFNQYYLKAYLILSPHTGV
jgi:hypothetical protein